MYADQVEQFSAVESGLCFGRLDADDGGRALHRPDRHLRHRRRLRPAADGLAGPGRPRRSTSPPPPTPQGVRRRRHLRTRERKVIGLNDEVLDLETASPTAPRGADRRGVAARRAQRRPHRPDARHRRDHPGRAGPDHPRRPAGRAGGAGRPRHRQDRRRAAPRRVPALHPPRAALHPGRAAGRARTPPSCATSRRCCRRWPRRACCCGPPATSSRGSAPAVPSRPRPPRSRAARCWPRCSPPPSGTGSGCPTSRWRSSCRSGRCCGWTRRPYAQARDRVRRTDRPHNLARALFDIEIVHALADQVAERIGADPLGGENLLRGGRPSPRSAASCARNPRSRAALDRLWPVLTPQRLLADLYAAPTGSPPPRPMLTDGRAGPAAPRRPGGWTPADVPLLDEAAELLGEDERAAAARRERIRACQREYAEGVLEIARGSRSIDVEDEAEGGEILGVTDLIDADRLLERQEESDRLTTAAAGRRRPGLGVRARHRRRGAGAVADGLAAADAPLPEPVDDHRRGRGADRRAGRHPVLGRGAGAVRGAAVAAGGADRQLPHSGRDHGGRRRGARRDRPGAAPTPLGTPQRGAAVGPAVAPDAARRGAGRRRRPGDGAAGARDRTGGSG